MKELKAGYEFGAGELAILQAGMEARDRYLDARARLEKEGMTIEDRWGQVKINPLCTVERDARAQFMQAMKILDLNAQGVE